MIKISVFLQVFVVLTLFFTPVIGQSNSVTIIFENEQEMVFEGNVNAQLYLSNPMVWAENATVKIFQSTNPSDALSTEPTGLQEVKLVMGKNSVDFFQVIVTAGSSDLDSVGVQVTDFTSGTNTLSSSNVNVFYEYYVNVRSETSYESVVDYELGLYPDALIPLSNSFSVSANLNQPLWVEVRVPENTSPGVYTGTISTTGDVQQSIQVTLEVLDYSLPSTHPLVNFAYADYWELKSFSEYSKQEQQDLILEYTRFFAEHGILTIGSWEAFSVFPEKENGKWVFQDWWDSLQPLTEIWSQYMNPLLLQVPVNFQDTFEASLDDATGEEVQNEYVEFLTQFKEFVQGNSEIPSGTVWYVWIDDLDEPDTALKAWLLGKYAELTASVNTAEFQFQYRIDGSIDWKSKAVAYDLDTDTSDWTNLEDKFTMLHAPQEDFEFDSEFLLNTVKAGKKTFMYQQAWSAFAEGSEEIPPGFSKDRSYEFPSLPGIVNPAIFSRVLPWLSLRYNITGIGFWAVMAWYDALKDGVLDMFTADPALRIYEGSDERVQNGDGWLVYPGNKIDEHTNQQDVFGPVASLRLELFRKGLEDFKYLKLISDSLNHFQGNSRSQAVSILDDAKALVGTVTTFSRDPSQYDAVVLEAKAFLSLNKDDLVTDFKPVRWEIPWSPSPVTESPPLELEDYLILAGAIAGVLLLGVIVFIVLRMRKK